MIKNLSYVNSRYILGFSFFEHDLLMNIFIKINRNNENDLSVIDYIDTNNENILNQLTDSEKYLLKIQKDPPTNEPSYLTLFMSYLNNDLIKKLSDENKKYILQSGKSIEEIADHIPGEYLGKYKDCFDNYLCSIYRNSIAHFNLMYKIGEYAQDISKITSYFQLYHYCMQKHLIWVCKKYWNDKAAKEGETPLNDTQIFENKYNPNFTQKLLLCEEYHNYNKDVVKYLCLPLAYNIPRYKALTIEALFDKDNKPVDD